MVNIFFATMLKRFSSCVTIIVVGGLLVHSLSRVASYLDARSVSETTKLSPTVSRDSKVHMPRNETFPNLRKQSTTVRIKPKYVVYTCKEGNMCGGYADREKGIVASYLLANVTKRIFKVDLTTPCDIGLFLKPAQENWIVDSREFEGLTIHEARLIDDKSESFRKQLVSHHVNDKIKADVFKVTMNLDYVRFFLQSKLYEKDLAWAKDMQLSGVYKYVLKRLFSLNPKLQDTLYEFLAAKVGKKKLVCAQIRIGRNPSNANDPPINDISKLGKVWKFLSQYDDPDKYRLFITTDAQQVRDEGKKRFPKLILDTEGEIVHVERSKAKNVCTHQQKVILDQEILEHCDVLLVSNSGFGRIGAFRRGKDTDLYYWNDNEISAPRMNSFDFIRKNW